MKKDIFVKITHENMKYLHELYTFTSNWEYPQEEREFYKEDLGKIETKSCVFRFVKHVNVTKEDRQPFFLAKPDSSELKSVSLDEAMDHLKAFIDK